MLCSSKNNGPAHNPRETIRQVRNVGHSRRQLAWSLEKKNCDERKAAGDCSRLKEKRETGQLNAVHDP